MHNLTNLVLFACGWNLIGYSAIANNFSLSSAVFTNSSNSYAWDDAVAAGTVQAYLSYYDSSPASAVNRKFKYVSTLSGFDDTQLRGNKGYWIYANSSGNLTLPNVGGSYENATYDWSRLYFRNSSGVVKGITGAGASGWVESNLQYTAGGTAYTFKTICGTTSGLSGCDKTTIYSWEGIFIKSNFDNMTLIRQNLCLNM